MKVQLILKTVRHFLRAVNQTSLKQTMDSERLRDGLAENGIGLPAALRSKGSGQGTEQLQASNKDRDDSFVPLRGDPFAPGDRLTHVKCEGTVLNPALPPVPQYRHQL